MVGAWGRSQHCPALLAKQLSAGQRHEKEVKTPLKESISCIFSRKRGKLHKEDAQCLCVLQGRMQLGVQGAGDVPSVTGADGEHPKEPWP